MVCPRNCDGVAIAGMLGLTRLRGQRLLITAAITAAVPSGAAGRRSGDRSASRTRTGLLLERAFESNALRTPSETEQSPHRIVAYLNRRTPDWTLCPARADQVLVLAGPLRYLRRSVFCSLTKTENTAHEGWRCWGLARSLA